MKKLTVIILSVLFLCSVVIPVFAASAHSKQDSVAMDVIHGTIVSVDTAKKEVVVKDNKAGQEKTFTVSEKIAAVLTSLKAGEKVKIKTKSGSSVAESIKVVTAETKKK